jgi:hypothetical protein
MITLDEIRVYNIWDKVREFVSKDIEANVPRSRCQKRGYKKLTALYEAEDVDLIHGGRGHKTYLWRRSQ